MKSFSPPCQSSYRHRQAPSCGAYNRVNLTIKLPPAKGPGPRTAARQPTLTQDTALCCSCLRPWCRICQKLDSRCGMASRMRYTTMMPWHTLTQLLVSPARVDGSRGCVSPASGGAKRSPKLAGDQLIMMAAGRRACRSSAAPMCAQWYQCRSRGCRTRAGVPETGLVSMSLPCCWARLAWSALRSFPCRCSARRRTSVYRRVQASKGYFSAGVHRNWSVRPAQAFVSVCCVPAITGSCVRTRRDSV